MVAVVLSFHFEKLAFVIFGAVLLSSGLSLSCFKVIVAFAGVSLTVPSPSSPHT